MTRPLAAVWLVAVVAVFALFAWSMHQDSPEPFALPPTMPVTAISDIQGDVVHVLVDNLPTVVPAPTRGQTLPPTDTPGVPFCPVTVGQICEIPPAIVTVLPTEPILCDATAMALMSPGVVCLWSNPPTFVTTP